ncbi:MAG: transglycosylase SLT domain-containing protein [Thermodesulfobacteriota bacterium]|nr:transglycosylase SLT domain-containing protein [Thermodesulfobacteriota bacterium]
MDGQGPSIVGKGQTGTLFLKGQEIVGQHILKVKAYILAKHSDRLQIGKALRVVFHITGEAQDSPAGRVGWYRTFTHRDFFPHLGSFPPASQATAKPRGLGKIIYEGQSLARYERRRERDSIRDLIRWASQKYRIPVALLTAVIEVESGFDARAVSHKGAKGLMQLMPATCERFGVQRPFSPQENVEGGAKYLNYLIHQWSYRFPSYRRLEFSLAAYHAGERKVELYGGVPPFEATREYVRKVLKRYRSSDRT